MTGLSSLGRRTVGLLTFAFVLFAGGLVAWGQEAEWPSYPELSARGPGSYFAIYKIFCFVAIAWMWMYSADWINTDSEMHCSKTGLKRELWNPLFAFTFFFCFLLLALTIPIFIAGFFLSLLAYAIPVGIYIVQRNQKLGPEDRVLTPDHIKKWLANFGKKKSGEEDRKKEPHEYGAPVEFVPQGGKDQENQANLITSRQSPQFVPAKELMADAINARAFKMMLDYTAEGVAAKYMIDGTWVAVTPKLHEKDPFDRVMGDGILAILKKLCNLNPADRRGKQEGKLRIDYQGNKYNTTFVSQGTPTGERALLTFIQVVKFPPGIEELGMREKHRETLKQLLAKRGDLIAICSMPGDGLSATWTGVLKQADRLTRDFVCFEDVNKREPELENIEIVKYDSTKGESPMTRMGEILLKQPEILLIPEINSGDVLKVVVMSCVDDEKKGIVSLRAKEAAEAIIRLLALKPPIEQFTQSISAVINQRLIRKLCDDCKEAYQPDPAFLQKLGIPAGKVTNLYREKQPPPPGAEPPKKKKGEPEVCPKCRGLGYYGRTAIYEILLIDDAIREAIKTQPKLEVIKQLAKKGGNWSLQEEGILLLVQGTTSLQELQRVLKV